MCGRARDTARTRHGSKARHRCGARIQILENLVDPLLKQPLASAAPSTKRAFPCTPHPPPSSSRSQHPLAPKLLWPELNLNKSISNLNFFRRWVFVKYLRRALSPSKTEPLLPECTAACALEARPVRGLCAAVRGLCAGFVDSGVNMNRVRSYPQLNANVEWVNQPGKSSHRKGARAHAHARVAPAKRVPLSSGS